MARIKPPAAFNKVDYSSERGHAAVGCNACGCGAAFMRFKQAVKSQHLASSPPVKWLGGSLFRGVTTIDVAIKPNPKAETIGCWPSVVYFQYQHRGTYGPSWI